MKGYLILIVFFSLLTNICASQDNDVDRKFSFGYNYGRSIAKGDYGSHSTTNLPISNIYKPAKGDTTSLSGYAQTGFHYDVYATYELIRYCSVMAAVFGDQSSYDINSLSGQYAAFNKPNTYLVVTGDNYYVVQYLLGAYFNPRVAGNLHFEIKLLGGLTTANYPGISFILNPNVQAADYTNTTYKGGEAFGFNVGGGINYGAVIGPIGLGAHLNLDYESANISYPSYSVTHYSASYYLSSNYNIPKTMQINIIQVTLGLSVEF